MLESTKEMVDQTRWVETVVKEDSTSGLGTGEYAHELRSSIQMEEWAGEKQISSD